MSFNNVKLEAYFASLGCAYWHEYPYAYGKLDVKDKTIVIVGNECGSSALFFLMRGAKRVIGYEKKEQLTKKLREEVCPKFNICDKVEARGAWDGTEYPDADVFVIDCEGCESKLDVETLRKKYPQFCVAVHEWTENRTKLLESLVGTTLTYVTPDGKELVFCKLPEPEIEEYDDGFFVDFRGDPYDVEYHDAGVQVWRDRRGKIVAFDIVYEDEEDVTTPKNPNSS